MLSESAALLQPDDNEAGMMTANELLAIGAIVFVASFVGVLAVRALATRRRWLDHPNSRSSHTTPTPRGGGIAIVLTVTCASILLLARDNLLTGPWAMVMAAAMIVAFVSWIDDLRPLANRIRFSVHASAAIMVLASFGNIQLPVIGTISPGAAGSALILLWMVGLTNAYNFMDGIDLMAAGQAVAAGGGWALLASLTGSHDLLLVGSVIAFAAAGFAVHNRPPARIFMGDVGSAFLGYLIAAMAVIAAHRDLLLGVCGVLLVWPFVFDTSFTFLRRLRNREPVFEAHRSHLYQRLVIAGMTHMQVSLLYFALDLVGVGCAAALMTALPGAPAIAVISVFVSASGLWVFVTQTEKKARAAAARA